MRNDFEGQFWAEHHHEFSDAVARLLSSVGVAMKRLNAIQFEAPWKRDTVGGEECAKR